MLSILLSLNGTKFQIKGRKYLKEVLPQTSVFTHGTLKSHLDLKLYELSLSIFTKMLFSDKHF